VAVGLYGCDRATKLAAEGGLEGGAAVPVAPGGLGDGVELRDFIHVKGWPVFNVADVAVVVGISLVRLASLRGRREDAPPAHAA
jgi:lipoprotein signal peptidase